MPGGPSRHARLARPWSMVRRVLHRARTAWADVAWAMFAGLNLAAMRLLPAWQTVPFLVIWVSLTVVYGFRLWRLQPAIFTLAMVTLATGGIIGAQVAQGEQDADYLVLVPMVALMFLAMVWHGRRWQAALEEVQRVSGENLRLLRQQQLFLLDASHELGTPITVALGHAELIEQAASDKVVAEDARVVVGELGRLRRLAGRLLLLASAASPGFLRLTLVAADSLVIDALDRWGYIPRRWRVGEIAEVTVLGDRDRLDAALDALLENSVAHTGADDRIELSARLEDGQMVLAVADSGCGIPAADLERIFGRFARAAPYRSREVGGFGLGLPMVQAIAEAHGGSVRVRSTVGQGSAFEIALPAATPARPGDRAANLDEPSAESQRRLRLGSGCKHRTNTTPGLGQINTGTTRTKRHALACPGKLCCGVGRARGPGTLPAPSRWARRWRLAGRRAALIMTGVTRADGSGWGAVLRRRTRAASRRKRAACAAGHGT